MVLAGFYAEPLRFAFPPAFVREARIRVAAEWREPDLAAVSAFAAEGLLSLDGLITHRRSAGEAPVTSAWLPRLRVKATALPKPIVRAWILRGGPPRARDGLNFRPPFPAMRITMSLHGATVDARFLGQFRPRKRAPQRYPARDGSSG